MKEFLKKIYIDSPKIVGLIILISILIIGILLLIDILVTII